MRKSFPLVTILLVSILMFIAVSMILPVRGAPGQGTSITVKNVATGTSPSSDWSYTITELNPQKNKQFTASFTLQAAGGDTYSIGGLRSGTYKIVETFKSGYFASMAITSNTYSGSEVVIGFEVDVDIAPSEGKIVTFTNLNVAFAMAGVVLSPPLDLGYSIPPLQPVPVQAAWDVDVNDDGKWDLVLDKPIVMLVNLEGPSFEPSDAITVSLAFEGQVHSRDVDASDLASGKTVVSFYSADDPTVPSSAGDKEITGVYQVNGEAPVDLTTTYVTVKDTVGLSLYYAELTKSNYGSPATFSEMVTQSSNFINATYPVDSVTVTEASESITGSKPGKGRNPYAGLLSDAQAVAQQAQLYMGGSAVGVAIAPTGYFAYHGVSGAVGVSFGPAVKGVIAEEGYWTVPAHEVAHTFGLFYGVPEEYVLPGAPFFASGVDFSTGLFRTGYSFMSVAEYDTIDLTWVNTNSTYEYLFSKTVVIPNDPEILLVSGRMYENDLGEIISVDFPHDLVRMQEGTPDIISPGRYLLKYVDQGGITLGQVSFDASFSLQTSTPDENGDLTTGPTTETHEAGFSFATPYPPLGTTEIQVVDSLTGALLGIYNVADVNPFSCSASIDGTDGLNDWYVSPVDVTITATADPTAIQPYYVSEIHYKLDGSETTVYDSSTQFTIQEDGIYNLEYWAVDNLDNIGRHHLQEIKVDKTAPTVTLTPDRSADHNGWYNHAISWTVDASDDTSGVTSKDSDFSYNSPDSATASVTAYATDAAGNTGSATVTFKYDATPPSITGSRNPLANMNGWNNVDVTVSFTATDTISGIDTVTADTTLTGEGADQSVTGSATDKAGNTASTAVYGINIDKTAPTITINSPADTWYTISQSVAADWSATDSLSGINSASGTVANGQTINTSSVGTKTFTVTASDKAGNTATMTVTYNVCYVFVGFLSPIPGSQYNLGRTVPVKFQLKDSQGNFVTTANAKIFVAQKVGGVWADYDIGADNTFRVTGDQYIFNLNTDSLSAGELRIKVELDDGTSHTVEIILK